MGTQLDPAAENISSVLPIIEFGRDVCNRQSAFEKEWLVTNGLGSYASGTLSGALTRRYHGYLIAALEPPLRRTLLFTKLDETIICGDQRYPIFTNIWPDRKVDPPGYKSIDSFSLIGTTPQWVYRFGEYQLNKQIWMHPGENTTYVQYQYQSGSFPLAIEAKVFINYRSHHSNSWRVPREFEIKASPLGLHVMCDRQVPFWIFCLGAVIHTDGDWYRDFFYPVEAYRGLDAMDDHFLAGSIRFALQPGESCVVIASTNPEPELNPATAWQLRQDYETTLLVQAGKFIPLDEYPHKVQHTIPAPIKSLVLTADQFIVSRPTEIDPEGKTVIAGYPWFSDWGRDTMISLTGLTLVTGRMEIARKILQTFAVYIDQGMLPNRFPSAGTRPEYNTVDATLWYFIAIFEYLQVSEDITFLEALFPHLSEMIKWHLQGTRYQIKVDPADSLLYAGEAGVQLTWMDAKVGEWVVTPRIGKPVEINALWYNAVTIMRDFAHRLGESEDFYQELSADILASFQKFWIPRLNYLYDVIEGPAGADTSLRPNQIFAISLPYSPLTADQQSKILDVCTQSLLTSFGLRSLAPEHPGYIGSYGGNQHQRDAAYHQGTVWTWLLGPYISARLRLEQNPEQARLLLAPLFRQLSDHCIGSLSEICEGNSPHAPRGCIAQAWSVAEVLRIWAQINLDNAG